MDSLKKTEPAVARAESLARAIVCAGGVDTSYVRAGRGSPIVMVTDDVDAAGAREVIASLAREHLVFAAAPTLTDAASLGVWLRGFIDGLGIGEAHLLLHASLSTKVILGEARVGD